jgi:hypothetical protein
MLALAVFGSAMALGAVHTTVLLIATGGLAAASWLAWQGAEPMRPRPAATLLFWTCVLLTAWTALQALPIPLTWMRVLAPGNADVWDRALLPLREAGPSWATLSLDPVATRVQVTRGIAYLLAFVAAVRIANRRQGGAFLEGTLVATGLALAVAAWLHPAFGADKVFGIYQPMHAPGVRHVAPILNANVLSGYLNIALCVAFGQAIRAQPEFPRPISIAVVTFLLATQFWVASRGGMLGVGVGLTLTLWMTRAPGPGERPLLRGFFVPAVLVLAGIGMGVLASSDEAWLELADSDVSKLQIALRALHLVPLFPVFGVGRGAFETIYPVVRNDAAGHLLYAHPENIVAQWATEWGPAAALVASIAILVALRPRSALARSPRAAGAWAALACVGVQNLVDFSSEYPGVVIALTVCAALVTGGTSGVDPRRATDAWSRGPRTIAAGSLLLAAVGMLVALPGVGRELYPDREALRLLALDPKASLTEFHSEARAAMLRHPAEPYLPFMGALRAVRAKDESVMPWIERTLERALEYAPAHLLLARVLAARSPAQARLEYRLTLEQAPEFAGLVGEEAVRLVHGYDDATELEIPGSRAIYWTNALSESLGRRLPSTAARLDLDLARIDPGSTALALRQATAALDDLADGEGAPWCASDRKRCLDTALARAARVEQLAPTRCGGFALHARALLETGAGVLAVKELSDASTVVGDRTQCLEQLAGVALAAKADAPLTQALDEIAHAGCVDAKECVANLRFVASFEESRGYPRRALVMLVRAHERDPLDDGLLDDTARLASHVDLHAEALKAYEELARRHPDEARWSAAVASEREALLRGAEKSP